MAPLSVRFALSRFLDPAFVLLLALGVGLAVRAQAPSPAEAS